MQEREALRREKALNRAKRSALSSSTVSALPTTKRNIGFSYGLVLDEIPNEGEDTVIKYHNWNEFQERLDDLEEEKHNLDKQLEKHELMDYQQ
jgi:tetrahydromethanopterin S-methyltransferase subunit G